VSVLIAMREDEGEFENKGNESDKNLFLKAWLSI
jgi:hypothetical protein